jgi:serine/threonine protein kinase
MSPPLPAHRPLPPGYVLDVYQFEQVLGNAGAFGITYAARNLSAGRRVAIKELFPSDYVVRDATDHVVVQTTADEQIFIEAVRMFRREADILSRVKHENVVKVFDYLEANGTGYMVMQYEEGYDLRSHLDRQKPYRLNENELKKLLMPLLDGLEAVHDLNYLHRDIKPSNIYLTRGHKPLLLDFGAARQMVVSRSRPVEQILTPPYGAIEQYGQASPQGPFTDIYAIGVVLFTAMLAGERFPNAPDRLSRDPFVPMSQRLRGQEYSEEFLSAIDWALKLRAEQRPQSIRAWRQALNLTRGVSIVQKSQHTPGPSHSIASWAKPENWLQFWQKNYRTIFFVLAGIIFLTIVITWILSLVP